MNIIFGDAVQLIPDRYTVLELDSVRFMPADQVLPVWCVIENIPMEELARVDNNVKMHQDLIQQYRERNWHFCSQATSALMGQWGGELDTFYMHLMDRVAGFQLAPPPDSWDGTLTKFSEVPNSLAQSGAEA